MMAATRTPVGGASGSRRSLLWIGAGLFLLMILLLGWLAAAKLDERRRELINLMERQKLQTSQMAQDGRIIADLVFGELRLAFRALDFPVGAGTGNLRQEADHYEYLYGRPGATQNIDRLLTGNLVGLVSAKTDPQLARLQKVLQHLFERDLNILGHKWSSRVAYTYWMSKDQSHAFSVPRWDFDAAIANSPLKSAKSAMAALASAMLVPFASQIKPAEMQIFRTDAWIDTTDGRVLQTMVSPMFDAKGEWIGNAAVDFALEEIDQMLAQSGLQQAQWLLVAPGNTVLARHVDKQGPLGPLLWGKALSESAITLPPAKDGAESAADGYRINIAAVPGSNLHLYLLTPSGWIYQDLTVFLMIAFAGMLAIGFSLLPVASHQRQRDEAAQARIRAAEIKVQQEMARHERNLQLNAWAGRLASVLQKKSEDGASFANAVLCELVPALGGVVGAFFLRTAADETFSCVAGYNIATERCLPFCLGGGMAGAAALAQQVTLCQDIPQGYLGVRSGTLDLDPIAIAAIPVRLDGVVMALIEVGYLELPSEQDLVLAEALPVIAFSLELFERKQVTLTELRERSVIEAHQRLVVDSEGQIVELKQEINELLVQRGQAEKYRIVV